METLGRIKINASNEKHYNGKEEWLLVHQQTGLGQGNSEFVETCQEKLSQKEKKNKKYQNRMFKSCKTIKRFKIQELGIPKGEERGKEEIFKVIMAEKFSQMDDRHQTTNLGSSENTVQANCKKSALRYIILKLQKLKEEILSKARGA